MKKLYFFVALCATAMVSCTSKELAIDSPSEEPIKPENLAALDSAHFYYKHIIDSLIVR